MENPDHGLHGPSPPYICVYVCINDANETKNEGGL